MTILSKIRTAFGHEEPAKPQRELFRRNGFTEKRARALRRIRGEEE